ncbi:hypothetical protein FS837_012133 [Tulasnella sp. UAMH 9824]|nr:hypothetical protein FS837_012133 [Tulasnella sp. UAMH 9824]
MAAITDATTHTSSPDLLLHIFRKISAPLAHNSLGGRARIPFSALTHQRAPPYFGPVHAPTVLNYTHSDQRNVDVKGGASDGKSRFSNAGIVRPMEKQSLDSTIGDEKPARAAPLTIPGTSLSEPRRQAQYHFSASQFDWRFGSYWPTAPSAPRTLWSRRQVQPEDRCTAQPNRYHKLLRSLLPHATQQRNTSKSVKSDGVFLEFLLSCFVMSFLKRLHRKKARRTIFLDLVLL